MQNGTPHDEVDKSNLKDARGTSSGLFILNDGSLFQLIY